MRELSPDKRILFVGLNTVDLQFLVSEFPAANTKTKAKHNEIFVGGPATNAAIACAHLGSKTDLYTPIGKHTLSGFILKDLENYGLRVIDPIAHSEGKPVFASIITSAHNGERTILSYHPDKKGNKEYHINLNIRDYQLTMFDGFHPEYSLAIAQQCRAHGITTVLDGGSWKPGMKDLLAFIDVAICSNDFSVPEGDSPSAVMDFLHNSGVTEVAITRGDRSILYSHKDIQGELEVESIQAIDTLGAGDIFHGAFCHYYNESRDFAISLKKASQIAAKSCLSFGTRQWMYQ